MSLLAEPTAEAAPAAPAQISSPAPAAAPIVQPASGGGGATPLAAQTVQKPWYDGMMNEKGDFSPDVWEKLPDELKGYKATFAQNKNINGMMMHMANLASLAGKKGLAPLPDGASDEMKTARAELMRQINGVPAKPEEYGVTRPDDFPEEFWSEDYMKNAAAIMHKYHAPPAMVKELLESERQFTLKQLEEHKGQSEAAEKAGKEELVTKLKAEWKSPEAFAKNIDLARRAVVTAGLDPNDPVFGTEAGIKLAAFFGSRTSEDRLVSGSSTENTGLNDYAKANDIIANADNAQHKAYHDPSHPLHQQAVQTVNAFMSAHAKRRGKA